MAGGVMWVARPCGCAFEAFMGKKRPKVCECGNLFERPEVEEARRERVRRSGPTLKQGRGFAAHPKQREKVAGRPCVQCGAGPDDGAVIDPAHLWPRGLGGCDDPACVIPLCRAHHRLYDEGKLSLLSRLVDRGYFVEMAHAIEAHELSPLRLVNHTTGEEHEPVGRLKARVVELEATLASTVAREAA